MENIVLVALDLESGSFGTVYKGETMTGTGAEFLEFSRKLTSEVKDSLWTQLYDNNNSQSN